MDNSEKIQIFYDSCTEMTKAKFILADAKISKILKMIVSCPDLVDVVSESLNGFNFQNEFSKMQVKNSGNRIKLNLPNDPQKLVAVVFSLLSEIDSHRIDLHTFIFDYFNDGDSNLLACYDRFVETIIIPFRDTMCELAGVEFEVEEPETNDDISQDVDADFENSIGYDDIVETDDQEQQSYNEIVDTFFKDIRVILTQIKDTINLDNHIRDDRKDELNITIDALINTIRYKDLKIMNALMISLNYLLHSVRSVKFYNMELQNRLAKFYSDLY